MFGHAMIVSNHLPEEDRLIVDGVLEHNPRARIPEIEQALCAADGDTSAHVQFLRQGEDPGDKPVYLLTKNGGLAPLSALRHSSR